MGARLSPARLSRINLVAGRLLRYPIVTHLLDDADARHCCVQDGPSAPAPALLDDTCAADVRYCGSCARAVLIPIIQRIQARCDGDPLLDINLALTMTPPDEEAAVLRVLSPALVELDGYVEQIGGRHA